MRRSRRARIGKLLALSVLAVGTIALAFPEPARSEIPPELEHRRIVDVVIEGETAGLTPAREIGIPLGAPANRRLLRATIERLVASGRWADVQLDLVPVPGGVRLVARLEPRIVLTRVQFAGNRVLGDDELARTLPVSEGSELRQEDLKSFAELVRAAYVERGYREAHVEVSFRDTDDPMQKVLLVRIVEGRPTRIMALRFEGEPAHRVRGVAQAIGLSLGDIVDERRITEGVRNGEVKLRQSGYFEAQLGPARIEVSGAQATVIVPSRLGPRFLVHVQGADPLERGSVRDVIRLDEERLVGPAVLEAARQRVIDLYLRSGFPDVDVAIFRSPGRVPGEVTLVFAIEPGAHVQIVRVVFPGARHFPIELLREQVASYLEEELSRQTIFEPVDSDTVERLGLGGQRPGKERVAKKPLLVEPQSVFYEPTYAEAIEHIRELYQAEGYLDASVGPPRLHRLEDGKAAVEIPVREGPRSMLHSVEFRGNRYLTARELLKESGLRRGMPFSHLALEQARIRVTDLYREQGYSYARVEPEVLFSEDRTRADVVFQVVERFPVRIAEVRIEGASRTRESLVRDRIPMRPGDLYRPSLVRDTQARLMDLGIFGGVTVAPEDADVPARVKTIVVTVTERKPQYLDLTGGLSTGQGVRGGFEYGYRNIFGYGLGLSMRVQLAYQFLFFERVLAERFDRLTLSDRLERLVTLGLTLPHIPTLPNVRTTLRVYHQRDNERDFGMDRNGVGLGFAYRVSRRVTFTVSEDVENSNVGLFLNTNYEDYLRNTTDPRLRRILRVPEGESTLVATRGTFSLDLRDNAFTPTRGFFGSSTLEWARTLRTESLDVGAAQAEEFFSNHLKLTVGATGYVPLARRLVLALHLRVGRVFHLARSSRTYPNRRFFLGGIDTMRGYFEDAMIPQDLADRIARDPNLGPNDVLRGGDAFVLARSELRFPIVGELNGGLFTDFGNVWASADELDPFRLRPVAGLGLRISTPVGPIALDYGVNLMRRKNLAEPFGALHFSIGLF